MMEWIASSILLILVVLALRAALGKRISAGLRYGLWAVVLVRLLVPVSFFALSVPAAQLPVWDAAETMLEESLYILPIDSAPLEHSGVYAAEDGALMDSNTFGYPRLTDDGERVVRYADRISPLELLRWIWAAGAAVMGTVLVIANVRFSRRLRRMRKPVERTSAPTPVYVVSGLPSPCLMGVLRPAVYVTAEAVNDPAMLRHVLAHELTHYNHRDHLWSVLRGIALTVHWWNPLVWLAVVCSRQDGELACDEGALKQLGDEERTAYGETLLALVTAKSRPGDLFSFATTMSGGKRSLKERIQRIACQPKTLVSAMVVVVAVAVLSSVVAFGQAKETPDEAGTPEALPVETPYADTWQSPDIVLMPDGILELGYDVPGGVEIVRSNPVPAPREWADDDLAGRSEATALEGLPIIWAEMVSPTDGWLVACYERGVAAADTYVYKTVDGGMTWTEVSQPGTSWFISVISFLSPDRLIVAQRMFNDAPCFITKDGGETWEEIPLPDEMVTAASFDGAAVTLYVGPNETENSTYTMTSSDLGDHWTVTPVGPLQSVQADLDHDGRPDELILQSEPDPSGFSYDGTRWTLQCTLSGGGTWEIEGMPSLPGENAVFLYRMDGKDYLLVYTPNFWHGQGYYDYRLIWLDGGREVVVQENSVDFDARFREDSVFEPERIAAFMDEVNVLLSGSIQLVNTNIYLQNVFTDEGRLHDRLYWLDNTREDDLSLLENLQNYAAYSQDHPDDTWSPLADLLQDLTEEDIPMFDSDTAGLVRMLKAGERGSRFYTWASEADAYLGHGADEVDYTIWNIPLTDGNTLWLMACEERASVLVMLETQDGTYSAFYDAPELKDMICRESSPSMADVMANIGEENIYNIADGKHMTDVLEGLHRIADKLSREGDNTEKIVGFIPVGYKLSADEQYMHTIYLKATETEGHLRIVCHGWQKVPVHSEDQEDGAAHFQLEWYEVVYHADDEELYRAICDWGIKNETVLERYQED